jgi:exosortase/archaeosortase family protein
VAYIVRGPVWKRTLLFFSGFPIFYLLNVLRIAIIILLWHSAGPDISEAYHIVSGSIMVAVGSFIILLGGEKILGLKIKSLRTKTEKCSSCDRCAQLEEKMCLFCGKVLGRIKHSFTQSTWERIAVLLFISFVTVFTTVANAYPTEATSKRITDLDIKTIEGSETADYFLPKLEGWNQQFAYRDTRIESVLNQDAALAYRYSPILDTEMSERGIIAPSLYTSIQISTGHHVWEDSLVTHPSRIGRPAATILESDNIAISDEKQGKFLLFKRLGSESTEAVIYWFERSPLKFGSGFENRNVLISIWANTDSLTRSNMIDGPADSKGIKELYMSLARPIQLYWKEQSVGLNTGEILYSFFGKNVAVLLFIIIIPTALFLIHYQIRRASLSSKIYKLYHKLVSEEKYFVDALSPAINSNKLHTGDSILRTYQQISGKQHIDQDHILDKLQIARRSGLVKNGIASVNDEPLLVWRTSIREDRRSKDLRRILNILQRPSLRQGKQ